MNENEKKKTNKTAIIIAIIIAFALVLIAVAVLVFISRKSEQKPESDLRLELNQDEYTGGPAEDVDHSRSVILPGWTSMTIPANTTEIESGIEFFNPIQNSGYYFMSFELWVDENKDGDYETLLYKSDLIEPGNKVSHVTLTKPLDKGEYDALVHIQPYKAGDLTETNNGSLTIKLYVK